MGSKPPHLTPNIPGGISEGLRTGHRPATAPLPVGQCLDPSQTGPHTRHASADLTPGSGVDSTHWSLLHSPAGGDEFARLILKAYKVVTTTESSVDDERPLNRRASPRRLGASHRVKPSGSAQLALRTRSSPRQPTVLRRLIEPPPPQSSYSTTPSSTVR